MNRAESRRLFVRTLWRDLADPFPGRLAQAWRIALVCALATMMSAVYTTPAAAIGCFLVFFVMKPDAAEGSVMAVALVVLVSLVLVLLVFLTRWTIDVPAWRFLVLISVSLVLLYLGSASLLGELGGIITLVVFFVLTLLSDVPFGEVATRGILYAGLMAGTPMACVVVVNLTMGIKPLRLLRQTLDQRLLMCAEWIERPTPQSRAALSEHVWEGQEIELKRMGLTRLFALGRKAELRRVARALRESYRLSMLALTLPNDLPQSVRDEMSVAIRRAAQALSRGEVVQDPGPVPVGMPDEAQPIWTALQDLAGTPKQYPVDGPGDSFFRADARTNPEHVRYAIKTTVAAMICYLTYTAVQWQGIHTAMITCYVAALGSVAETTHKMVLRITGCLIGAALGVGSILFIMPYITSVGAIMALVFVVTFIAAWVWVGNERVSYAGVQVALAFLLTVLQASGPTLDMGTARDRIVGVLLGNVVLYVVFTRLWPISAVRRAWESLQHTMLHLAAMGRIPNDKPAAQDLRISYASKIAALLADYRRVTNLIYFEAARRRPSNAEVARTTKIASALRVITLQWVKHPQVNDVAVQQMASLANECPMTEGAGAEASRKWGEQQANGDRINAQDRELRTLRGLIDDR